jgi:hypothetical protein
LDVADFIWVRWFKGLTCDFWAEFEEKNLVNSILLAERNLESVDGLVVADAFELAG